MRAAAVAIALAAAAAGCMKPDRSGAKVELADARLEMVQQDGTKHVLSLSATGALAFDGETFATITADSRLLVGGKETGKLEKDGVLWAQGVPSNVVIKPGGTFVMNGVDEVRLDEDGVATGPLLATMDHPRMDLDGAKVTYVGPPGARRPLMTGFAAFVTRTPLEPAPK